MNLPFSPAKPLYSNFCFLISRSWRRKWRVISVASLPPRATSSSSSRINSQNWGIAINTFNTPSGVTPSSVPCHKDAGWGMKLLLAVISTNSRCSSSSNSSSRGGGPTVFGRVCARDSPKHLGGCRRGMVDIGRVRLCGFYAFLLTVTRFVPPFILALDGLICQVFELFIFPISYKSQNQGTGEKAYNPFDFVLDYVYKKYIGTKKV